MGAIYTYVVFLDPIDNKVRYKLEHLINRPAFVFSKASFSAAAALLLSSFFFFFFFSLHQHKSDIALTENVDIYP